MYIKRDLDLSKDLKSKSVFLLGPRQTGKSSYIRSQLPEHILYNLLLPDTFNALNFDPQSLVRDIPDNQKIVVIDEIQKLPSLLDVIHYLIGEKKVHFLLTGSSARKLKGNHVNLLGGRARIKHLNPFSIKELGDEFHLEKAVNRGLLPGHYFSDDIDADLVSYVGTYLQQEIANEGLTRNVPAFSRFLEIAAMGHAEQMNFTQIASDAQVPRTTVHEYYQILKDTLIAIEVPAWQKSRKRKPVSTSKYYFFDWGLVRKMQRLGTIEPGSPQFGKAFESLIFQELKNYCDQQSGGAELCYWRTKDQVEVDFVLNDEIAIEVKAKSSIKASDIKSLERLREEKKLRRYILVYTGERPQRFPEFPQIEILPYTQFLDELG